MNNLLTDITVLLDRSGSMYSCRNDVLGGLNNFIRDQQKIEGACKFTLIQFHSMNPQEKIYDAVDLRKISGITTFNPGGGTPLLDALGLSIVETGARLRAVPEHERPGKVIFVVITDGEENASHRYKKPKIAEMVKEQQDRYAWDFVFLGANMDGISEGQSVGMLYANSATFDVSNIGATIRTTGAKLATYRMTGNKTDLNYTVAERKGFVDGSMSGK